MTTTTFTTAEVTAAAEAVIAQLQGDTFNVRQLVDEARAKLALAPQKVETETQQIIITDPGQKAAVNELLARASELERIKKSAEGEREQIKLLLKEVLGDAEELVIDGAVVATFKTSEKWIVNQRQVQSLYPRLLGDKPIAGNEGYYTRQQTRTFNFK